VGPRTRIMVKEKYKVEGDEGDEESKSICGMSHYNAANSYSARTSSKRLLLTYSFFAAATLVNSLA
jgi:hypothetical protein